MDCQEWQNSKKNRANFGFWVLSGQTGWSLKFTPSFSGVYLIYFLKSSNSHIHGRSQERPLSFLGWHDGDMEEKEYFLTSSSYWHRCLLYLCKVSPITFVVNRSCKGGDRWKEKTNGLVWQPVDLPVLAWDWLAHHRQLISTTELKRKRRRSVVRVYNKSLVVI